MINVEHNRPYSPGLLVLNCFWTLVFGFFALRLDRDPEQCEASDINDIRFGSLGAQSREERFIDIGERFRIIFEVNFFGYLSMTVIGTATYIISEETTRKFMFFLLAVLNYCVFFAWVFAFYVRTQHSGKVCSGDFLRDGDSTEGYLIDQGRFIKYALICIATLFSVAVLLVLCKILRQPTSKPNETELERL